MTIIKWLAPSGSAVNGHALVRVEADEVATIEDFLVLVDGDNVGHYGFRVELTALDQEPSIEVAKYGGKPIGAGHYRAVQQFGFPRATEIRKSVRYYDVFVHRD